MQARILRGNVADARQSRSSATDAQSIYSFRGATSGTFWTFRRQFWRDRNEPGSGTTGRPSDPGHDQQLIIARARTVHQGAWTKRTGGDRHASSRRATRKIRREGMTTGSWSCTSPGTPLPRDGGAVPCRYLSEAAGDPPFGESGPPQDSRSRRGGACAFSTAHVKDVLAFLRVWRTPQRRT